MEEIKQTNKTNLIIDGAFKRQKDRMKIKLEEIKIPKAYLIVFNTFFDTCKKDIQKQLSNKPDMENSNGNYNKH